MSTGDRAPRGRGRPRTPGAEDRILEAALAEYGEHGWSGFTMDAVARRARVGKSTVYLRWSDKDALLTEAVTTRGLELATVDTGSLEGDLTQLALNLLRHFHGQAGWAALRVTFDTASVDDRLGDFAEAGSAVHARHMEQIYQRAVERGELVEGFPVRVITAAVYGATMVNALTERLERRTDEDAELQVRASQLAAMLLRGIAPRPSVT